jgi:hypothetical protein
MIARDVGGSITTTTRHKPLETQRVAAADTGGPLIMPDELEIPF